MGGRTRPIRVKIASLLLVPLVSLVAIWSFATTLTVGEGISLLRIRGLYDPVVVPLHKLTTALQEERLRSSVFLGDATDRAVLDRSRAATNSALETLERDALTEETRASMPRTMLQRIDELTTHLERLSDIRSRVDTGTFSRSQTLEAYSAVLDTALRVFDSIKVDGGLELLEQGNAVVMMTRVHEMISQQDALLSGALASRKFTGEEHTTFRRLVDNRRMLYELAFHKLDADLRQPFYQLQNDPLYQRYEAVEDRIATAIRPDRQLPAESAEWPGTIDELAAEFTEVTRRVSRELSERVEPIAMGILIRIAVAAGLGLIAVAASIYFMLRFAGSISSELSRLREAALELADRRLPRVVERLRRGETVNVAEEAPEIRTGTTREIVDVEEAFSSVQRTAIEAAVGQAEIRKGVNQVFLNLARRSQSLLHRQLAMLESMERRATDPEILEDLFGLDHLTTRMRRHAEGLIILSGAVPARGWRNPVSLFDVIRASVEEVEDYLRVSVDIQQTPSLVGNAVTDVIHLLAELVENATIFSPPNTRVHIRGESVARGYAVEIEDRGLGMSAEEFAQINEKLANPPEFNLADSDRLGLFVVGRLAARHGIQVSLRPSPYGGTTAIVLIPSQLVVDQPELPAQDRQTTVERISEAETGGAVVPHRSSDDGGGPHTGPHPAPNGNGPHTGPQPAPNGGGLPRRVRQANLVPQLRKPVPPEARQRPAAVDPGDNPAGSAALLASFKAGWERAEQESE